MGKLAKTAWKWGRSFVSNTAYKLLLSNNVAMTKRKGENWSKKFPESTNWIFSCIAVSEGGGDEPASKEDPPADSC